MADQGQYPPLVDPGFSDFANNAYAALLARRAQPAPPAPPPPQPPNGILTDLGHGLARSAMVTTPQLFGQALQAFGADETGKNIADAAAARANDPAYRVTGLTGEAASMLAPALGVGALALIPGVGEISTPVLGGSLAAELGGAALFGGSQYTQTREKGGSVEQALGTGAVQGVGQAVGGALAGKLLSGATTFVKKAALQDGFNAFLNPGVVGKTVADTAKTTAMQLPVQAAAAAGVAGIETGLPDTPTPWEAAKESFAPTAMMTALMAPFAAAHTLVTNRARAQLAATLQDPTQSFKTRSDALQRIAAQLGQYDKEGAEAWRQEALQAIHNGAVPELRPDYKYEPSTPDEPPAAPLALPAPGQVPEPMGGPGGPQTPLDPVIQRAQENAAEHAQAVYAARDAEEARLAPLRERPPTYDVQEGGPVEHIGIGTPPETIDIHAPEEVPTYPVHEGGADTIDIKSPEQYADTNKQQRVSWLKEVLGAKANVAVSKLAGLHSEELAQAVQRLWNEKGGEAAKSAYVQRLGDLYTRVTGKDIREPLFDNPAQELQTVEDSTRRIITGVEGLTGQDKYAALRENAQRERVLKEAQDALRKIDDTQEKPNEGSQNDQGSKPGPAASAPAAEAPSTGEQVRQATGDARPGAVASEAPQKRPLTPQEVANQFAAPPDALLPGDKVPYGAFSKQPPTQGELDAALTRKESTGSVPEREGTGGQRAAEGINREQPGQVQGAGAENGGGNRAIEGGQKQGDAEAQAAHQAAIDAAQRSEDVARAALEAKTPELQQARARLAEIDQKVQTLGKARAEYRELSMRKKLNQQEYAYRQALQKRIGELAAEQRAIVESGEREELTQRINELQDAAEQLPETRNFSNAVGRTERALQRGEREQAADPAYYVFQKGLDPNTGVGEGTNLQRTANYLEAHRYAGTLPYVMKQIPAALRKIVQGLALGDSMLGPRYSGVRAAAREALRSLGGGEDEVKALNTPEHQRFIQYATRIAAAIQKAAEVNEAGKAAEERHVRALSEWTKLHMQFDYENAKIAEMVRSGAVTVEEARSVMASIDRQREGALRDLGGKTSDELATDMFNAVYGKFERNLAESDKAGTGLTRLDNAKLAARVTETPHAEGVLDHIARTHHNPVIRAVAKLMAAGKPTASIKVIENPDFNGGRYVPSTDTIEIGRGGMNTTTMLHEITHALTHAAITRALGNMGRAFGDVTPQARKEMQAVSEIQSIMRRFERIADPNNPEHTLALQDEHEFISEALNNPDFQEALGGRAGLFTRLMDKVRDLVGWPERQKSDFEKLMQAAPALFGNPNRSLTTTFRSYLSRTPELDKLQSVMRSLSGIDWAKSKFDESNLPAEIKQRGLSFTTLNHQKQLFRNLADRAKQQFPSAAQHIERVAQVYDQFRGHLADRQGITLLTLTEANDIALRALQLRSKDRASFDKIGQVGTEATRLRIDASAKTFEEAKARNSQLTLEEWNSPDAQRLRAAYRNAPEAARALYHDMVGHHDLMMTRAAAENMAVMLRTYGAHLLPEMKPVMEMLDSKKQAGRGPGDIPAETQRIALDRGMRQALSIVKEIQEREHSAGGPKSKGALDAASLKSMMDDLYAWHSMQRTVPYMHIGRAGDKMVMFTVKGGDKEWNDVAKVVNASRKEGGLERGMGPPLNGNRRVYMKFDNDSHYMEAVEKLRPFLESKTVGDWADGAIDEKLRSQDSATPGFVRALRDRINGSEQFDAETKKDLTSQLFDTFLQQLPDNSPLKASATRDGVNGYSTDYIRSFSDRATMAAQSLARVRSSSRIADTMTNLGDAMKNLREDVSPGMQQFKLDTGRYVKEFRGRVDDLNRPVSAPFVDRLRAFPAAWRLALSPAYVAMLAYQPWQVTMPTLGARFGFGKSALTMGKNSALAMGILQRAMKMGWLNSEGADLFTRAASLSNMKLEFAKMTKADGSPLFNAHQLDLLNHVQWSGLLNFGQVNQIARLDPSEHSIGAKAASAATVFPHFAEIGNRLISALTAHELAMDKADPNWRNNRELAPEGSPLADAHAKAKDYALQVIRDTDGDHSQANVARALGRRGVFGAATPLFVGFQQFDIQMTEMMARNFIKLRSGSKAEQIEAAKVLGGVAGMTSLMAGALGLPFMGLAAGISNAVTSLFQDNNDTPPDAQLAVRHFIGNFVGGGKAEEVLSRGLPRLLDLDMSTRAGFQDLAPFTPFLEDRRKMDDRIKDHAFDFLGPSIGAAAGVATGAYALTQGDYPKFINDALPAFARNLGKSYRLANYGYETEGSNNQIPIAAPSAWNILAQAAGFQSSARAEQSEASFTYNTNQQLLERRQQFLRNEMYRAFDHGDYDKLADVMQENVKFAMQHPQFHASIREGLQQRMQERAVGAATGTGILANKRAVYPILQQFPQQ